MKYELTTIALWMIAIVTTLILTRNNGLFTYLGPVFFICLVGSILTVRAAYRGRYGKQ